MAPGLLQRLLGSPALSDLLRQDLVGPLKLRRSFRDPQLQLVARLAQRVQRRVPLCLGLPALGDVDPRPDDVLDGAVCTEQRRVCLLYTSPSPRDRTRSRMPSSA